MFVTPPRNRGGVIVSLQFVSVCVCMCVCMCVCVCVCVCVCDIILDISKTIENILMKLGRYVGS